MRQEDLLNQYLDELMSNPTTSPPSGLDEETAEFARQLAASQRVTPPRRATQDRLWQEIVHQAGSPPTHRPSENGAKPIRLDGNRPTLHVWAAIAAAMMIIAFLGIMVMAPQKDNSEEDAPGAQVISASATAASATIRPSPTPYHAPPTTNLELPSYQSEAEPITIGDSLDGTLTADQPRYVYALDGKAGDLLSLRITSDMPVSMSYVRLNRPQIGERPSSLSASGGGGGGGGGGGDGTTNYYEHQTPLELEQDSLIWVIISVFEPGETVNYTLSLEPRLVHEISYGDTITGTLETITNTAYFDFEGQRGDIISIVVESEPDLLMTVEDANGQTLIIDDDSGAGHNPEISNLQLPVDGPYRIRINTFVPQYSENSDFTLSLLAQEPQQIQLDTTHQVHIPSKQKAVVLVFDGRAGQTIVLTVESFYIESLIVIAVEQNDQTLTSIDLFGTSSTEGTSINASREFIVPDNGEVTIFINQETTPTTPPYGFYTTLGITLETD